MKKIILSFLILNSLNARAESEACLDAKSRLDRAHINMTRARKDWESKSENKQKTFGTSEISDNSILTIVRLETEVRKACK